MEPSAPNEDLLLQCQRFRVEKARHQTPDGTWHQREVVRHPGSVVIVPMVTPDSVCLIRNFRVAVADWLVELPAGTLEPDEPLEETAYRELIEETGFTATTVRHLHSVYAAPGILDEYMRLFVAEGLTPGASAREAGELIENQPRRH